MHYDVHEKGGYMNFSFSFIQSIVTVIQLLFPWFPSTARWTVCSMLFMSSILTVIRHTFDVALSICILMFWSYLYIFVIREAIFLHIMFFFMSRALSSGISGKLGWGMKCAGLLFVLWIFRWIYFLRKARRQKSRVNGEWFKETIAALTAMLWCGSSLGTLSWE